MTKLTVLIGEAVGESKLSRLKDAYPQVRFLYCPSDKEFIAHAQEADIIFTKRLPLQALKGATKLRWVQAGTSGIGHLLDMGLRERDILLTNAVGAHGIPMSELLLGMMLAFVTGLNALIRVQSAQERPRDQIIGNKTELEGQVLCILGLGDIGGTLCRKAKGLGMYVLGVRRSQIPFPDVDEQFTPDKLTMVLPRADHVALCLPLTAETKHIIGERELRLMKPSAYIYNVGRGASIDTVALERALREGWIAGAGLDVTDPEPLPDNSPFWNMPNVILSQHTSGSSPYNADRITAI
ncbi:MAG: D-2-hydroxyacid dehydrogenase, partial [Synergistales bacterium]|nr:D-2-hydroxyacid dehydrogenase [Synergistales bacterium]